jgi:hypothetical protein
MLEAICTHANDIFFSDNRKVIPMLYQGTENASEPFWLFTFDLDILFTQTKKGWMQYKKSEGN